MNSGWMARHKQVLEMIFTVFFADLFMVWYFLSGWERPNLDVGPMRKPYVFVMSQQDINWAVFGIWFVDVLLIWVFMCIEKKRH